MHSSPLLIPRRHARLIEATPRRAVIARTGLRASYPVARNLRQRPTRLTKISRINDGDVTNVSLSGGRQNYHDWPTAIRMLLEKALAD